MLQFTLKLNSADLLIAVLVLLSGASGAEACDFKYNAGSCNVDYKLLAEASFRCALVYDDTAIIRKAFPGERIYLDSIQYLTDFPAHESRMFFLETDTVNKIQWVVFRGTNALRDWLVDGDEEMVDDPVLGIKVHRGFHAVTERLFSKIESALKKDSTLGIKKIYVTGHSLGGAMAVLTAAYIRKNHPDFHYTQCITFGQPKVTNGPGLKKLMDLGINLIRVVNNNDPVAVVPPADGFQIYETGRDLLDPKKRHYRVGPPYCNGLITCFIKASIRSLFNSDSSFHYFHLGYALHLDGNGNPACHADESPNDWKNVNIIWSGADHHMPVYDSLICRLADTLIRHHNLVALPVDTSIPPPELLPLARDRFLLSENNTLQGRYQVQLQTLTFDSAGGRKTLVGGLEINDQIGSGKKVDIPTSEWVGDNGYMKLSWNRLADSAFGVERRGALLVQPRPSHRLQFWTGTNLVLKYSWSELWDLRPDFALIADSRWLSRLAGSVQVRFLSFHEDNDLHKIFFPLAADANPFLHGQILRSEFFFDWLWLPWRFTPGFTSGFGYSSTPQGAPGMVELRPKYFFGLASPRILFPEEWFYYRLTFSYDRLWEPEGAQSNFTPFRWDTSLQLNLSPTWLIYPSLRLDASLPWSVSFYKNAAEIRVTLLFGLDMNAVAQVFSAR